MAGKYLSVHEQVNKSRRRSIVVVVGFVIFFGLIFSLIGYYFIGGGYYYSWTDFLISMLLSGGLGVLIALVIAFISYNRSGKILAKAADARKIERRESPMLYEMVGALAAGAQITEPDVYIIESGELNAFASGSGGGKSMVAVTRGLLEQLNREELEGVLSHEVSHLKNDDIKLVSLVAALAASMMMILNIFGRSMMFSRGTSMRSSEKNRSGGNALIAIMALVLTIFAVVLGPIIIRIMQSAVSKQREYLADASGAAITGYPLGLASALEKIAKYNNAYLENHETALHNGSLHALCISEPKIQKITQMFSTHPPIQDRIERLRNM